MRAWDPDRGPKGKAKSKGKTKGAAKGPKGPNGKPGGKGRGEQAAPAAPHRSPKDKAEEHARQAQERHLKRTRCMDCTWGCDLAGVEAAPFSDVRFLPCQHIVTCASCAVKRRHCSLCKALITDRALLKIDYVLQVDETQLESEMEEEPAAPAAEDGVPSWT